MKKKTYKRRRSPAPEASVNGDAQGMPNKITKRKSTPPTIEAKLKKLEAKLAKEKKTPARKEPARPPGGKKDILAAYMDQLSLIPLFTAEQENTQAKEILELDLRVWQTVLAAPKGVQHLLQTMADQEDSETLRPKIDNLLQHYQQIAARSSERKLPLHEGLQKQIEALAQELREFDSDKEILDQVMHRLRREVWSRRVIDATPAFRVTHNDMTDIERAYGALLRARNAFVRANLRLVVSVARNFHRYKIPFIDLIQEGNVGLMKAVHRFDHNRGFRFSTYAHWWIRQSIERAIINKGSQVRLPVHVIDSKRQVGRATKQLTQEFGRLPTTSELSDKLQMSPSKVDQVLSGVQPDPVSLDESIGSDDQRKFLDMLRDDESAIDETLIRENTHARVREMLHMLNPIEKDIIRRRFGIGDDSDQTLDEIGKIYNLSRERVRQIQAQGLQKIRRMCERRQID
jgi:RNA polymerase primary sigma factor